MQDINTYDIILKNNSTNQTWLLPKMKNVSLSSIYYQFDDFKMPEDAPFGEYTAYIIWDIRDDVEYHLEANVLDSDVVVDGSTFKVKDFRPSIEIMQYGMMESARPKNEYLKKNNDNEYMYL